MRKMVQWLAVASKKVKDGFKDKSYTWRMVMVPKPTIASPLPCILVSIRNGHSKLFFRVRSLEDYYQAFRLTTEEEEKIRLALVEANIEADKIEQGMRVIFEMRNLAPGSSIVRTDTGEIIAEAERIIQEGNR